MLRVAILKPAEGRHVRNHQRLMRPLNPNGELVTVDGQFQRALDAGDVVEVEPAEAAPAPAKKSK